MSSLTQGATSLEHQRGEHLEVTCHLGKGENGTVSNEESGRAGASCVCPRRKNLLPVRGVGVVTNHANEYKCATEPGRAV